MCIKIRKIEERDTERFFLMMCKLDEETEYMMYEPGERENKTKSLEHLQKVIKEAVSGSDFLWVAENDNGEIVGYIWAQRGKLRRIMHTAYIVIGIREAYRSMGIGSCFFKEMLAWAKSLGLARLELTVECENANAMRLYEKFGFQVEGTRSKSMKVNGNLIDEYYMGYILNS